MKKPAALIALLVFTGIFFSAQESKGVDDFGIFFDTISSVAQGSVNYGSNDLYIEGIADGNPIALKIMIEGASATEKDFAAYCRKAALLALSNNTKYRFDAGGEGNKDLASHLVEVDLSIIDHYLFCTLNLR